MKRNESLFSTVTTLIIVVVFSITGCKKKVYEADEHVNANNIVNSKRSGFSLNYKNSSNVHDNVGSRHNQILEYIEDENGIDETLHETILLVQDHDWALLDSIPWEDTIWTASSYEFRDFIENDMGTVKNDLNTFFDDGHDDNHYSSETRDFLKDIYDEFSVNMTCTSCSLQTFVQLRLTNIKTIETDVINSLVLTADEKEWVLSCASVARHSLYFWTMQARNSNNPWDIASISDYGDIDLDPLSPVVAAFWGASLGGGVGGLAVLGGMAGCASAIAAAMS